MPVWVKAAGKWGSIMVIIALVITFLKQAIAFIGFLTAAIKILVVLVFVLLIVGIGFMVFRAWNENRKNKS